MPQSRRNFHTGMISEHPMSRERRIIATPRGDFVFRPETPQDAPFLLRLFMPHTVKTLRLAGLPDEAIEKLVGFQHRAQTATHRGMFPDAIYSIVEFGGEQVGRFIEQDESDVVYFVDFALFPEHQAKGLGAALTRALMDEWAGRGRGTRVEVMVNNARCLKMCRGLGFTQGPPDDRAYVELRWYPPHLAPGPANKPR
jgi:ribosomal protein S18 acetylase RimI-like enzyme